jgi:hypothetical protein
MAPLNLCESLASLDDPRSRHGQFHPLSAVLGLVVLALLLGRTSLAGIARFGRQHGSALAWALGFRRGKTPAVSTLSRTLRRLDATQLESLLADWLKSRLKPEDYDRISLDGKTLRGSRSGEVPGVHLLAAYAPQVEAVLRQVRVDAKTNEHKAALELLGILPIRGKVVLGDAIFCQRDLAEKIIGSGGDYILIAKGNQPALETDLIAAFAYEDQARRSAGAVPPSGLGGTPRSERSR